MRIMTVRQPWAWAIMHGGKDVENRSRNIAGSYRGPVALHAAKAMSPLGVCDPLVQARRVAAGLTPDGKDGLEFGAIIGFVDLVDVHLHNDDAQCHRTADVLGWVRYDGKPVPEPVTCSAWGMSGFHHLVLANARPLAEPIVVGGKLGLWRPDDDLADALAAVA